MIGAADVIGASVENAGPHLRRSVQRAVALAVENQLEVDVLRAIDGRAQTGAKWLRAALTEAVSGADAALPLWENVLTSSGCEIPDILLHRGRFAFRAGDTSRSASLLRLALQSSPDFDFFLRAETLGRKCKAGFGSSRKIRIALLGSSTNVLLRSVMELLCLRDGLEPEFYEPPFGSFMSELLLVDSPLVQFKPQFVVLLLNWRDLGLPDSCQAPDVIEATSRVTQAWDSAIANTSAQIIQLSFVPAPYDGYNALSSVLPTGRVRALRNVNERLFASAPSRVTVLEAERIAANCGEQWEDADAWSSAKVYPSPKVLPVVAENIVSCIRAELGLSRKLLILDLDNTLWGGVIGEDGLGGIQLGPPSPGGERYQEFQRYVKSLGQRGVLLAVVSKNNHEDAAAVFDRHPGSQLRLKDFVSFKANWIDKPTNIRNLASELRLGLDSFVLLDDNPAERAAVRRELPEVIVPEISGEPTESIAALERGLYFQSVRLSSEDLARSASYHVGEQLEQLRQTSGSVEHYLRELSMKISSGNVDANSALRVTQLINKTNQFNLTTKRYTEEEVQLRSNSSDHWFRWYRLQDRFADHGLIGVLLAKRKQEEWIVDTWLMSCRVIARSVEEYMFRDLVVSARQAGATRVRASYLPTAKNKLVEGLLPRLGFDEVERAGEFSLELASAVLPDCSVFRADATQEESEQERVAS